MGFGSRHSRNLTVRDRFLRWPGVMIPSSRPSPPCPSSPPAPRRSCRWWRSRPTTSPCPAGKVVVSEGAAGTEFFVILDGRARVERHGREVASLGPGGFFGDLALLDRAPRNASVIADSELELAEARPARVRRPARAPRLLQEAAGRPRASPPPGRPRSPLSANAFAVTSPLVKRLRLPKPHQLVLVVGVLVALGTIASGIAPRITEWADESTRRPRAVRRRARRHVLGVLRHRRGDAVRVRVAREPAGAQLRAGRTRRPPHHQGQRPPPHARLPRRRVDADPAARPRRRPHALLHLLRLPLALRRHRGPRARPPAPRQPQVPPRRRLRGLRVHRRPRRRGVHRRHPVGVGPPLPRAALPHPDQDQARGRGHPAHLPRHRAHRVPHRGAADRGARSPRLRAVVVRRLPALVAVRRLVGRATSTPRTNGCGASTSPRSSRS